MAGANVKIDAHDLDRLMQAVDEYGTKAGRAINDFIHNQAPEIIEERIAQLIPRSGRTWRGKGAPAADVKPFSEVNTPMAVTIIANKPKKYHYLYFPDDGTSTRRHAGQQHFMARGAEAAANEVIERCLESMNFD